MIFNGLDCSGTKVRMEAHLDCVGIGLADLRPLCTTGPSIGGPYGPYRQVWPEMCPSNGLCGLALTRVDGYI